MSNLPCRLVTAMSTAPLLGSAGTTDPAWIARACSV